jgi:hypothetical protein
MYKKTFELLLRQTEFSKIIFKEIWDFLSSSERIYLMMNFEDLEEGIIEKALEDPNPFIRMLAVKATCIDENDNPKIYNKINKDESYIVQMALKRQKGLFSDANKLKSFDHAERLAIIALSEDGLSEESFAEFICEGLKGNLFSEREAREMLMEYLRNPNLVNKDIPYIPDDNPGYWIFSAEKNFDAIWNLTTCTPPDVHYLIANIYPLYLSNGHTIPDKILKNMSDDALERLIWRGYEPLINDINKNFERYSDNIKKEFFRIQDYREEEKEYIIRYKDDLNDDLNQKFNDFCVKLNHRLDKMYEEFKELLTRRRGIFS